MAMLGTGSIVSGSDMGSFSSTSKCISSNELLSTAASKQGNGKRYFNRICVIQWYIWAEVSSKILQATKKLNYLISK